MLGRAATYGPALPHEQLRTPAPLPAGPNLCPRCACWKIGPDRQEPTVRSFAVRLRRGGLTTGRASRVIAAASRAGIGWQPRCASPAIFKQVLHGLRHDREHRGPLRRQRRSDSSGRAVFPRDAKFARAHGACRRGCVTSCGPPSTAWPRRPTMAAPPDPCRDRPAGRSGTAPHRTAPHRTADGFTHTIDPVLGGRRAERDRATSGRSSPPTSTGSSTRCNRRPTPAGTPS